MAYMMEVYADGVHLLSELIPKIMPPENPDFGVPGKNVDPETMPKETVLNTRNKNIADFFIINPPDDPEAPNVAYRGVRGQFKDLIEEFEPGVHEFFPISVEQKNGTPIPGDYYVLNVRNRLDTAFIDLERSGKWAARRVFDDHPGWSYFSRIFSKKFEGYVKPELLEGKHLWWPLPLHERDFYLSQALGDEIKKRKFRGVELIHLKE